MRLKTSWQYWLAVVAVSTLGACGGGDGAADDGSAPAAASETPAGTGSADAESPMSRASTEPEAQPAASEPEEPAGPEYQILTEAPDGTPATFAELCAAQRAALAEGEEAMNALIEDLDDAEARAQLEASLRRTFELEPLTLEMEPPSAQAARVEAEAMTAVRDRFGAARKHLQSSPSGLLLFQDLQKAASSGD